MRVITLGSVSSGLDMFDAYTDTQTEAADQISQTFDVSGCNAVVVLNNYGVTCQLEVENTDTSTTYFDETVSLIRDNVADWFDYYFAPVRVGRDVVFYFEAATNAEATITINYSGGTAKCGMCVPGVASEVGGTRYGVSVGITDYSITTTNDFGVTYFSQGEWVKRASAELNILNTSLDSTAQKFVENVGTATVFDLNNYTDSINDGHTSEDGYQALIIFGVCEDFSETIPGPIASRCRVDVQGII